MKTGLGPNSSYKRKEMLKGIGENGEAVDTGFSG
jgi:hypothetical protein